jgi:hypothetical protein
MDGNLGSFSVLPTEIRRLILQKWISVANILKTETTSQSWRKICWDALTDINIRIPKTNEAAQKVMKNAPLARVRKFNVYLAYNGEASFTQFCPLTKMVSLKELSFGGIDIINEQSVRENVKLMTWIQSLQLRYNKKVTPNISEILISQTGLKKLVLGHASSLISIASIELLTKLTTLKLPFCDSIGDIELLRVFLYLTNLVTLDLTWLKKITPDSFMHITNLTNLTLLDISNCSMLPDSALSALLPLNRLAHLDMSFYNNLTDDAMVHVAKLTNLTRIVVTEKTLTDTGLARFTSLVKMKDLDISIGAHSCDFLRAMTNLERLSVNSITDALPPLPSLERLVFKSSTIKGALRQSLTNFVNLKSLHFLYCGVGKKVLNVVTTFSQLTSIYMYGARIEACEYLAKCTTLNIIEWNCRKNWSMLSTLTNLTSLRLTVGDAEDDDFSDEDFRGFALLSRLSSIHLTVRNQSQKDAILPHLDNMTPRREVRIAII